MSLQLTVLGGAAAWANPGQGCSSYLVRSDARSLLVDCGPDTLLELRRHIDFLTVDAVVISHMHADHILDLVPYRYGLVYGPHRAGRPIPLWLPPGGVSTLRALAEALRGGVEDGDTFWSDAFALREYDPAETLRVGDMSLSFAPTVHPISCYAMRVDHGDRALFYSADTGSNHDLLPLARGARLLLVEATSPEAAAGSTVHLAPREAGTFAAAAGAGTLILTHLWCERPDTDVTSEAGKAFAGRIAIAKPGLTVDV